MRNNVLILLVLMLFGSFSLFAGTTGKLAGKVKDVDSKAPVAYASVILDGTSIGAETKENGSYFIINIPAGTYDVLVQLMGYAPKKVTGVVIVADQTTTLNATIEQTALEMAEFVVVEQKEELVKKGQSSSIRTVTSDTIEDIAVEDIDDVLNMQAGVNVIGGEIYVRGGRANETAYTVDGMSVSDPVDGGKAMEVDMDAIADMSVMTGGLTAEYGNAQSGMVNIVTKSGSDKYQGKVEASSDHLFTDGTNQDIVKFGLGGPVLGSAFGLRDKFSFYINGAASWHDGRYKDYYVSDPVADFKFEGRDILVNTLYEKNDPYENRDDFAGFDIGNRNYNDYNWNLKTKYKLSSLQNLTFAYRGNLSKSNPFLYNWRYSLDTFIETETLNSQYVGTYEINFDTKTNLKVKMNYFRKESKSGPNGISEDEYFVSNPENYDPENLKYGFTGIDEDDDGVVDTGYFPSTFWQYSSQGTDVTTYVPFTTPGTIYNRLVDDVTENLSMRTDLEYQPNETHGFKTGFEIIKHHIKKDQTVDQWQIRIPRWNEYLESSIPETENIIDSLYVTNDNGDIEYKMYYYENSSRDSMKVSYLNDEELFVSFYKPDVYLNAAYSAAGDKDGYKADPWQFAYYLQDEMRFEGMIVNAGLRVDAWYLGESYDIANPDGSYSSLAFDESDRWQVMLSPRLSISHPISERDQINFVYNYQNQLPQMQYIFTSKKPEDAITSDNAIIVGNATLEPQITVTYEVGLQHQIGDYYVLDVTAYYKNIYNYPSIEEVELHGESQTKYWQYVSRDYGSAKGLDMNLSKRVSNYIGGTASYSLAWALGNNEGISFASDENLREFYLPWDIRQSASLNLQFLVTKDEDFKVPFTEIYLPYFGKFGDFSANFVYSITSGVPYTAATNEGTAKERYDSRYPWTQLASMKISKKISLGEKSNLKVYYDIQNLFNATNYDFIYSITGDPYFAGGQINGDDFDEISAEQQFMYKNAWHNPSNVGEGRTMKLGVSYNW